MTYRTNSAEETKKIAAELAGQLKGGEVIFLVGDLGAGKTTFAQGLGEALGVVVRISSPTFSIMNEYPCVRGAIRRLVHLDLYRFQSAEEFRALDLDDERRPDTVMLIEWPNIVRLLPVEADVIVQMDHRGGNERALSLQWPQSQPAE